MGLSHRTVCETLSNHQKVNCDFSRLDNKRFFTRRSMDNWIHGLPLENYLVINPKKFFESNYLVSRISLFS